MIYINFIGGLGNQMFIYALYTKMQLMNKKVAFDYTYYLSKGNKVGRQCNIFDTFILEKSFYREVKRGKRLQNFISAFIMKRVGYYREEDYGLFCKKALEIDKGYIDGYWQSYLYFDDIRDELLKRFVFRKALNKQSEHIKLKILNAECAVSIHIRLGDYTASGFVDIYGNICTPSYYLSAIGRVKRINPNAVFFVFSDEPQKVDSFLKDINYYVVDCNNGVDAWADMYLMSICKHNIIANSSFSWWGAYLNRNPEKIVIAPSRWLNNFNMPDICPPTWVRV